MPLRGEETVRSCIEIGDGIVDVGRFDRLARTLGAASTRRRALTGLLGLGLAGLHGAERVMAKKKPKPCKKAKDCGVGLTC
jgi:hypothetical protein